MNYQAALQLEEEQAQQLKSFIDSCKTSQVIWGLQDPDSLDWVICDSIDQDETEVMPLWSEKSLAIAFCTDEWADYKAATMSVDDYLEFLVSDLNYDGVLVGLNWDVEQDVEGQTSLELDPIDVAKAFAECEIELEA